VSTRDRACLALKFEHSWHLCKAQCTWTEKTGACHLDPLIKCNRTKTPLESWDLQPTLRTGPSQARRWSEGAKLAAENTYRIWTEWMRAEYAVRTLYRALFKLLSPSTLRGRDPRRFHQLTSRLWGSVYNCIQIYLNTLNTILYYIHIISYSYSPVFIFSGRVQDCIISMHIWIYSKFIFSYHIFGQHYWGPIWFPSATVVHFLGCIFRAADRDNLPRTQ
jgi:hypothetical protein